MELLRALLLLLFIELRTAARTSSSILLLADSSLAFVFPIPQSWSTIYPVTCLALINRFPNHEKYNFPAVITPSKVLRSKSFALYTFQKDKPKNNKKNNITINPNLCLISLNFKSKKITTTNIAINIQFIILFLSFSKKPKLLIYKNLSSLNFRYKETFKRSPLYFYIYPFLISVLV